MRASGLLPIFCTLLMGVGSASAQAQTARIYGVEIDVSGSRDRVIVFADGPLAPRILPGAGSEVTVEFESATLDATAPTELESSRTIAFSRVRSLEPQGASPPRVRIVISRGSGRMQRPEISTEGSQALLSFARRGGRASAGSPPRTTGDRVRPVPTRRLRRLNTEIRVVVDELAKFVGETLIYDETLSGVVSIEAPAPVSQDDARALLDALLLLKGRVAVPTPGGIRKIVAVRGAQGPWVTSLADDGGEAPVTTLIRLAEIDAAVVKQAIEPLVGPSAFVVPHPRANALILGGPAHRLRRIAEVVRELDEIGPRRIVLFNLDYADAERTADALSAAFGDTDLEVWPDARTNRLIVRGRPERVEAVRAFVARTDRPATGFGAIQVLPVRFSDVDRLAETLRTFQAASSADGAAARSGLAGRDFNLSVHAPSHSLVVQADPPTMSIIREVVGELDRVPARIEVEVAVAEVTLDASFALGFDMLLPLLEPDAPDDLVAFVLANPGGTALTTRSDAPLFAGYRKTPILLPLLDSITGDPILDPTSGEPITIPIPRDGYWITAEDRRAGSRVLMRPRLSLLAGEEHEIFAGDNVPVLTARADGGGSVFETNQNVERRDVGVRLQVAPTVGERGDVVLEIDLTVSRLTANAAGAAVGDVGPTIRERALNSVARLESGRTAVIAFASLPSKASTVSGTPFLKDVPLLGWLFKRVSEIELETLLIVTARAEVLRPEAEVLSRWLRGELERRSAAEPETSSVAIPAEVVADD